jgi:LPS-assembly protein
MMRSIITAVFLSLIVSIAGAEVPEYQTIDSDKINYNIRSEELKTSGRTEITSKSGPKMTLVDAYVSKRDAGGRNVVVEWDEHTLMSAEKFQKNDNLTFAESVSYTACHNCDPVGTAWTVHATDMTHDAIAKEMYFYNFWFDMYGVPILYLPFLVQPDPTVKYRSGLLIPEFASTSNMGTGINIPLYINFSNSHDMTLTGTYLTRENPLLTGEHRLRLEHASFDTRGSFTHSRDGLDRWHLFQKDTIELGEHARLLAMIQRTSDKTYLQKYDFYGDQPFLESSARLEAFAERGYATIEGNVFQELRQKLPTSQAVIPKGDILPGVHGVYQVGITDNLYSQFMGDVMRISDVRSDYWAANRAIGEMRLVAPVELAWQKFTLSASARQDYYKYVNMSGLSSGEARFLPSGYVDWEMPFVKNGEAWTQVVKPKARVTFIGTSDNKDVVNMDSTGALLSDLSLFQNNRYSGYDLWVNGTYVDYGLSWSGYNSDGQSAEVFVGQTYDFDTDKEPDPDSGYHRGASDVVGRIGFSPNDWLGLTNRFRLAKETLGIRHLETDVKIGNKNYITFGYIWAVQFSEANGTYARNENISEGMIGAGFGLTDRLRAAINGIYNFTDKRPQRYDAGLYYEHPCYTLGLVYRADNAVKDGADELNFHGAKSLRLKFAIKIGGQ